MPFTLLRRTKQQSGLASRPRVRRDKLHSVAIESLEDRLLLASGTFAAFSGDLATVGEVDAIPISLPAANFTLPGGRVAIGIAVHAAGSGNSLDPGQLTLVPAVKKNKVKSLGSRIDVSAQDNTSFLLAQVKPGNFTLQVRAEGATLGAYDVEVFLAGDLNNDFQVTQAEVTQITGLSGTRLGAPGYLEDADVNRSGVIDKQDQKPAKTNLGAATTLRPVNRAPRILAPLGPLSVMPGARLDLTLQATDPDGNPVSFEIDAAGTLPTGTFDGIRQLSFTPAPGELGSYQFDVIASDGTLESRQTVTLNVTSDNVTTTRLSGVVQRTNQQPISGVMVEVGAVQTVTNAAGEFLLDLGNGLVPSDTIKVRAELLTGPETFPFIAEKIEFLLGHELYAGVNNTISRPIFLPALDMANAVHVDPMQDTTVTTAAIPGIELRVAAGTLMNQQGTPFNGMLSITQVPVDLTPAALPEGLFPDLVVTIQPGEMVFAQPAPLDFPNTAGPNGERWAAGTVMDLWSINPVTGEFDDVGDTMVSADGNTIETISGGVRNSSWHFVAPRPPKCNPKPDNPG